MAAPAGSTDRPSVRRLYNKGAMLAFFVPVALSSLVTGLRGPVLDAGLARTEEPLLALAGFAAVSSLVFVLTTASQVQQSVFLVYANGRESLRRVFLFTAYGASAAFLLALLAAIPALSGFLLEGLMGASDEVTDYARPAFLLLALIPPLVVARALFQSVLMQRRQTRRITFATFGGLAALVPGGLLFVPLAPLNGALAAALTLIAVTIVEGGILAFFAIAELRARPYPKTETAPLPTMGDLLRFGWPLLLSMLAMSGSTPLITAGIFRLEDGVIAVAGFRIAWSIAILGLSLTLAVRQTALVMSKYPESHRHGREFSALVGLAVSAGLLLLTTGPIGDFVMLTVIGVPESVAAQAFPAVWALAAVPFLLGFRQFFIALLMHQGLSKRVGIGTLARVAVMLVVVFAIAPFVPVAGALMGGLARLSGQFSETVVAWRLGRVWFGQDPLSAGRDTRVR